jgi:hypothetical protein
MVRKKLRGKDSGSFGLVASLTAGRVAFLDVANDPMNNIVVVLRGNRVHPCLSHADRNIRAGSGMCDQAIGF